MLQTVSIFAWDLKCTQEHSPKFFPPICASFAWKTFATRDGCAAVCCSLRAHCTWCKSEEKTLDSNFLNQLKAPCKKLKQFGAKK